MKEKEAKRKSSLIFLFFSFFIFLFFLLDVVFQSILYKKDREIESKFRRHTDIQRDERAILHIYMTENV